MTDIFGLAGFAAAQKNAAVLSGNGSAADNVAAQKMIAAAEGVARAAQFRVWDARLAGAIAGKRRCKVAIVGDSIVAGFGAADTNQGNRAFSFPTRLAERLAVQGIPVNTASFWGSASRHADADYDPRLVRGNGWVIDPFSVRSLGGPVWYNNSTTNPLAFSPPGTFDSADVYAITNTTAQGQITIDIGGATLATVNLLGTAALIKTTVTFPRTTNPTLNIRRVDASGSVRVTAAVLFDSLNPAVEIYNCGQSGATAGDAAANTNPWEPRPALRAVAPDLTLIGFGSNDENPANNVSQATFAANLRLVRDDALLSGDVAHFTQPPASTGLTTIALQDQYADVIRAVAVEKGLPVIDVYRAIGSYARGNALGEYYDILHPGAAGHIRLARLFERALVRP